MFEHPVFARPYTRVVDRRSYGRKSKPRFEIVDWRLTAETNTTVPVERQLTASDDDFGNGNGNCNTNLNDEIPF